MPDTPPEPFVPPRALVHNPDGPGWWAFDNVRSAEITHSLDRVREVLAAAEAAAEEGLWAVGFLAYEAAPAFDRAISTHRPGGEPLAGFLICDPPTPVADATLAALAGTDFEIADLAPTVAPQEHAEGVERIKRWIADGSTYQVNYTYPLTGRLDGDAWSLFLALLRGQGSRYAAWLDLESHAVCSASPELFFSLDGERIVSRPMKGTAPRGRTTAEDRAQSATLAASEKNLAENVMIVDMIRNDLARIARRGTVRTSSLFDVERYATVFQLTSTVEAATDRSVGEILTALFPCASITGAPKIRTMRLIKELEKRPRGLYTGAVGWLAPKRRAQFSVAIRTAVIERAGGRLTYGTGGGIVWDSEPAAEYAESADKARILTAPRPPFDLLETLAWRPAEGYLLLDRHLDRLIDSARYFDFAVERSVAEARLADEAVRWRVARRVRLIASRDGSLDVTSVPLEVTNATVLLACATTPLDSRDPFLFHKTTHREIYERARRAHPDADDVLLWNERGELTETTIANVVLKLGGKLWTPPLSSGLLGGTLRAAEIAAGKIEERVLLRSDLDSVEGIYLLNSVRGWRAGRLAT